jgi:hypothetical protein
MADVPDDEYASRYYGIKRNRPHLHTTETGLLVRCYHSTRAVCLRYSFWIGMTVGFPIEHFLYERVPPFTWIAQWMGLH